jgi:hypothetical protein
MSAKHPFRLRLLALVLVLAPVMAGAGAQEARPLKRSAEDRAETSGRGQPTKVPDAPVGHRQPRAADIPANLPKDELAQLIDRINRTLDRRLQICRGC